VNGKYYIGLSIGHNATAALLRNGKVLSCVSEERFNRIKNYAGFPARALRHFIDDYTISPDSIARVSTNFLYLPPQLMVARAGAVSPAYLARELLRGIGCRLPPVARLEESLYRSYMRTFGRRFASRQRAEIARFLGVGPEKVVPCDHHEAHAHSAYFGSPFRGRDALVLTLDGEGDFYAATVSVARADRIERIAATPMSASLGVLYSALTRYLGMTPLEHEYKIMGLAPYAQEKYFSGLYGRIRSIIRLDPARPLVFASAFDLHRAESWMEKNLRRIRFDVIAGAFQKATEDLIAEWAQACVRATGIRRVCCAGGVFMNVKANKRILELDEVDELFIFPSSGDESTPIGAAYAWHRRDGEGEIPPLGDVYWGPECAAAEIDRALAGLPSGRYRVERPHSIAAEIARLLASGKIVAVLQGRMEFGARALGNRSILADPSDRSVVERINKAIKGRDFWMPFAATILEERARDYIVNPKNHYAPYMINSFDTTERARKELAAAIHPYDKTLRPQVLRKEWNPSYHAIIAEFEKLSGIGGVLNTSFNLHGYPIVMTAVDALQVLADSGLEYLALGDRLVSKTDQRCGR
jgi:carbamoyltransferase